MCQSVVADFAPVPGAELTRFARPRTASQNFRVFAQKSIMRNSLVLHRNREQPRGPLWVIFSTEVADFAARPTSASLRKLTSGPN